MPRRDPNITYTKKRFWSKVKTGEKNDCWTWLAYKDKKWKYGVFGFNGKLYKAHRFAWFLTHGQMPDNNMLVCHKCDNPSCVNPHHLFLGTNDDNMKDMVSKGRSVHRCAENCPSAKLTIEKAREIRIKFNSGNYTWLELSKLYCVCESTIGNIVHNRTYKENDKEKTK